jgi:hypothetical protein
MPLTDAQAEMVVPASTYKRGSLPPAFNYVDGEFSVSLQVAARAKGSR